MSLNNTQLTVTLTGGETKTVGKQTCPAPVNLVFTPPVLTDGTAADPAQKIATVSGSITAGAAVTHDLTAIVGPFGTVNFSQIKEIIIVITGGTGDVIVGNAASNQFQGPLSAPTTTQTVPNNGSGSGILPWINHSAGGWTVDGTHKSLKIDA